MPRGVYKRGEPKVAPTIVDAPKIIYERVKPVVVLPTGALALQQAAELFQRNGVMLYTSQVRKLIETGKLQGGTFAVPHRVNLYWFALRQDVLRYARQKRTGLRN